MAKKIKDWFNKGNENIETVIEMPLLQEGRFLLKVDGIVMAILSYEKGDWYFKYTDDFKQVADKYNLIVGFPDINKIYKSESLWPFFLIRIPGLKQPAIKEILAKEKINENNELELLKYFGKRSISNPYELVFE